MVSVDVMLGASGAAGFMFGLVRTRLADHRGGRHLVQNGDLGESLPGTAAHVTDAADIAEDC